MSELREEKKTQQEWSPIEPIGKYSNVSLAKFKEDVNMNGNFKVKCVDSNGRDLYTTGKIYDVAGGVITFDSGLTSPAKFNKLEDLVGWSSAKWEDVKSAKSTTGESITIRRKKSKVIATLSIDGEFKYSQYIKLVDANGDFKTAVKMVVEGLMGKWKGGVETVPNDTDLTAKVLVDGKNDVKVGDNIKVLASHFEDNNYEVGKIYRVFGLANDGCPRIADSADLYDIVTEGFEIVSETIEPATKQPNRQAEVGEYVKIIKTGCSPTAKVKYKNGDILKIIKVDELGVHYGTGSCEFLEEYEYEVVENPIKKVKRPAKVGEWVEILRVDSFTEDDHKVGDIFQAIKCTSGNSTDNAYYENKEDACGYVDFGDYLVLENYTPEVVEVVAKTPIAETPKFVKAKVGDKIRVVKVANFHRSEVKVGQVGNVIDVHFDSVVNTNDDGCCNTFFDDDKEYEIIDEPINPLSSFTQEQLMKELFNRQGL